MVKLDKQAIMCGDAERGQSLAMSVLLLCFALVFTALAVDFGFALMEKTRQTEVLQEAEANCFLPSTALKVKNSDTPGLDMCRELVTNIRNTGYDGAIDVYFYEPCETEAGIGDDKRVYVFGATLTQETPTVFAALMGIKMPDMATTRWSYAQPYASSKTWKPGTDTTSTGTYVHINAGADFDDWDPHTVNTASEASMPGVTAALESAGVSTT